MCQSQSPNSTPSTTAFPLVSLKFVLYLCVSINFSLSFKVRLLFTFYFFYGIYVLCFLRLKLISFNFQNYFSFISSFFLSSITPNMTKGHTNQLLKWLENS